MNAADTAALLSIMEGGRLVRAKKWRELNLAHPLWVVAATNRLGGLSPELKSRFAVRKIAAYSRSDFLTVVKGVLVRRENVAPDIAGQIADMLDDRTQDVRYAVRGYTNICNITAGKDHRTYDLAQSILNEEIEHESWFSEFLGEGPSGHFLRRGETSPFVSKFLK